MPPIIDAPEALFAAVDAHADANGAVALDAERASGYRYSHRAYLVQLRHPDVGTSLIDPIGCPDLSGLAAAIGDSEWILHAANQDLPCLADLGLRPKLLFDTELAGRLLDYPRVGLAFLVEAKLGLRLEKGHAAVDWSTRPLPEPWLVYAALDVEVLHDLRDQLAGELAAAGKLEWAVEEFAAIMNLPAREPRVEPWRRTSGIHKVRTRRQLGLVRELWQDRDAHAQHLDVAPGRVLPDAAIVAAALAEPASRGTLAGLPAFRSRTVRRELDRWWEALRRARSRSERDLPEQSAPPEGPPPPRAWADRDPPAAGRLAACRAALQELAQKHRLPVENLLTPEFVRRLTWSPPDEVTPATVGIALRELGAREWQIGLTARPLVDALTDA